MNKMLDSNSVYQVGGCLSGDASTYVWREADNQLYEWLSEGEFCYVLNSRQMGKSSLRVRTMERLQQDGFACAAIDITLIGTQKITPEKWYGGIIKSLVNIFDIKDKFNLRSWWNERNNLSPVQCFEEFIEKVLLNRITKRIVIFIDEIDSTLKLDFKDDFFALIRACYNKRADNFAYKRLSFVLLGVATPSDLIQDRDRTPFNIGKAVELQGFKSNEIRPLKKGLEDTFENTEVVLTEILHWEQVKYVNTNELKHEELLVTLTNYLHSSNVLTKLTCSLLHWTGGQPFLTQKICQLVSNTNAFITTNNIAKFVENSIRINIINNWESQDEPEHFKTIKNRLLNNKQRAGRWLGLYQQILQDGEIYTDDSSEHMELRLSGLVLKQDSNLKVCNHIYKLVFNLDWVEKELANLRPYSDSITAWVASNFQDSSRLLLGQTLQDAQQWAKDKSLSDLDYQFLSASEKLERENIQVSLDAEIKAKQIITKANQKIKHKNDKATQRIYTSLIISSVTFIAALVMMFQMYQVQQKLNETEKKLADARNELYDVNRKLTSSETLLLIKHQTVQINGEETGTGTIIRQNSNTYTVLTTAHIIDTPGKYQITTYDEKTYQLIEIIRLPNVDLALIKFSSNQQYEIAQIVDSQAIKPGTNAYIVGYPDPFPGFPERKFFTDSAQIQAVLSQAENRYRLIFDNSLIPGASGGGIFDLQGRLIGVSGQLISEANTGKTYGIGIPVEVYLNDFSLQ
ncbi:MAG: AAA-like domain-containing protein [Cyanobacteria bacterium P01_G01_bin.39]